MSRLPLVGQEDLDAEQKMLWDYILKGPRAASLSDRAADGTGAKTLRAGHKSAGRGYRFNLDCLILGVEGEAAAT